MNLIPRYILYIRSARRYSSRTVALYERVLDDFFASVSCDGTTLTDHLNPNEIRLYEVKLLDERKLTPKTVNLHLSVLSSFCRFLIKEGLIKSNPVSIVSRPKVSKRLPEFYRQDAMQEYFSNTEYFAGREELDAFLQAPMTKTGKQAYERRLARLILNLLYTLGIRRSELLGLTIESVDFGRKIVKIHGKGDKMREIPLLASLSEEILLYLKAVEALCGGERSLKEPLLVTYGMKPLYPVYVDRTVKGELGSAREWREALRAPTRTSR